MTSTVDEELPETLPRWEIPSDWQWVSIADVGKVITGNTPPTKDASNYGNHIPFVKPPALMDKGIRATPEGLSETGVHFSRTLPAGAVLVSCIGGLGKTGIAKVPVAFNQQINAIVFGQRVIPEFGFYYSQTLKPWLHGVSSATTLPIVNKGKFQRAPFPLAPLDQQKRIVAEIEKQFSRLDEAVANLKRVKANLKRYKAAVLKAAVEGRLVETEAELARRESHDYEPGGALLRRMLKERATAWVGRGKYRAPSLPREKENRIVPEGWAVASLEQLTPPNRPCAYGVLQPGNDVSSGVPIVRVGDIEDGRISLESLKTIGPAIAARYPRTQLEGGEVLVTLVGAIGRTAIVPRSLNGANVARAVAVVPIAHHVNARWVELWLRSPARTAEMNQAAHEVARKTLNLEDVRRMNVAIPPLTEQVRIAEAAERALSVAVTQENAVEQTIRRVERLRTAVLSMAFCKPRSIGL